MSDVRSISSPFLYQVTEASGMAYALHWNTTSSLTVALWSCGRSLINLNVGTAVNTHTTVNAHCLIYMQIILPIIILTENKDFKTLFVLKP